MHWNCVSFLKIYLFIAPICFGYSLAIIRVLVIWYSGRTMCTFSKIQLFTLVFLSFNLPFVKIINKILKMFCCLTLIYVVVCASRDGWLRTARSFTELQDRLRPHWIGWNPNHITSLHNGNVKRWHSVCSRTMTTFYLLSGRVHLHLSLWKLLRTSNGIGTKKTTRS